MMEIAIVDAIKTVVDDGVFVYLLVAVIKQSGNWNCSCGDCRKDKEVICWLYLYGK